MVYPDAGNENGPLTGFMDVVGVKHQSLALFPELLLITYTDPAFTLRKVQSQMSGQDEVGVIRVRLNASLGALPGEKYFHRGSLRVNETERRKDVHDEPHHMSHHYDKAYPILISW